MLYGRLFFRRTVKKSDKALSHSFCVLVVHTMFHDRIQRQGQISIQCAPCCSLYQHVGCDYRGTVTRQRYTDFSEPNISGLSRSSQHLYYGDNYTVKLQASIFPKLFS